MNISRTLKIDTENIFEDKCEYIYGDIYNYKVRYVFRIEVIPSCFCVLVCHQMSLIVF